MWHEARRQERKIRGMIVDYRKRAERRQDFYEKIKADPTQFIQLHGRKCKIHLDPAVAAAGDGAAIIVPWQGHQDNLIDRFDVRAHLDVIPVTPKVVPCEEIGAEERQCNYERYRILAQNDFLNLPEERFLHQLYLEEQYGANAQLEAERNLSKKKQSGAAIAYSYDDADSSTPFSHIPNATVHHNDDDNDSAESEIDMDVSVDISKLDTSQAHELNACGRNYGMLSNDFYSYLTKDVDEADAIRLAREEEQEKMMLSGRKSRRERRAQKEKRVAGRPLSPPSYAAKEETAGEAEDESDSRSSSPENSGKITYITSFGGEDELQPHSKILINLNKGAKPMAGSGMSQGQQMTYAQKVKENLAKLKQINEKKPERPKQYQCRSRSRSRSRGRYRRSSSKSRRNRRSRSRSQRRRYRRSRSRSRRSRSRSHSRSHRRRRYSSSSSSTSSNSSSNSRREKRRNSPKNQTSSTNKPWVPVRVTEPAIPPPVLPTPLMTEPPPPPMIQYPILPLRRNIAATPSAVVSAPEKPKIEIPQPLPEEPPPIKRYYGRKKPGDSSDSDEDITGAAGDSEDGNSNDEQEDQGTMDVETCSEKSYPLPHSSGVGTSFGVASSGIGKQSSKNLTAHGTNISSSTETKVSTSGNGNASKILNPRERLKRKMQILLNKQYKADKKAEIEKTERQMQQQQEREDEMRELALKLRRRQRELRHKYGTPKSSDGVKSSDDEPANVIKPKPRSRSASQSSNKSVKSHRSSHRGSRDRDKIRSRRSGSRDKYRGRTRSRSESVPRHRRRVSRSRSRHRRSSSRTHKRSPDRSRHYRDRDRDRDRQRDRDRDRDRDRERERDRDRDRDRIRDRERERDRDNTRYRRSRSKSKSRSNRYREQNRYQPPPPSRNYDRASGTSSQTNENERNNRNKIVISAPPKLKKLVDY